MLRQSVWTILLSLVVFILLWQLIIQIWHFPAFILPSPMQVWNRFLIALGDGSLLRHLGYTLIEILSGLCIGAGLATLLGYLLAKSPVAEHFLSPFLVASQAIPLVAVAPLLIIWFGPGMFSKILICALIVFFPVLVNTIVGVKAVPENLRDLMRSLQATPVQVLTRLEVPAALPVFLGGLRIGATLSVMGAVVGEFVGSDRGLGFLINVGRGQYDTALVFVGLFTLILLALVLYGIVILAEKHLLTWQKSKEEWR
jgi:NitT/TauT family transport system permease protein